MLTARRKNGELFSLAECTNREWIRKNFKKEEFYCPVCEQKVILKIGSKKIAHFAHQKDQSCTRDYYERESDYHLAGKLKLYDWLKKEGVKPNLEPYLPEIRQRPDILFIYDNKKYIIEFQCSAIPEEIMRKRTESYIVNGFIPLWIVGANQLNRKGKNSASFSSFQYLFLRKMDRTMFIPFFCPNTCQFIFLHSIVPLSIRNTIVSLSLIPLTTASINEIIYPVLKKIFSCSDWRKGIENFKRQLVMGPKAFSDPFLIEIYKNYLNVLHLPPHIGLPVFHSPYIETSPIIWQGYIWIDILSKCQPGDMITFDQVYSSFVSRVKRKHVKVRDFPLIEKGHPSFAVWEYLSLLSLTGALTKAGQRSYRVSTIIIPENSFQKSKLEEDFYQQYGKIIERNI
ncbi:Competence CoiA family protein [Bacillus methanolicus PB1]|uniref:Competence CoiA family protein n=1 Tax=Bacillus methanolicus PB1 TaxID=997296 RepID=I3E5S2_BACMT|nr:competence protein CoiA family protein [Bacillus methanolicus]EIJ81843.1 Competence CoiA family protein [Bacillus methanolicus PB1]